MRHTPRALAAPQTANQLGRRAWLFAALVACAAGCATPRSDAQLRSLDEHVKGLRLEVANCRKAIDALKEEHKRLASGLVSMQREMLKSFMNTLMASAGKAMKIFGDKTEHRAPASPSRSTGKPKRFQASKWVKRVGKNRYNIKRRGWQLVLSNPTRLARSARIVPTIRNGKPAGLRLYAIRPTSIYHALGLRNGDAIEQINGMPVTTPDTALKIYQRIRRARVITISVRRRSALFEMIYTVVP